MAYCARQHLECCKLTMPSRVNSARTSRWTVRPIASQKAQGKVPWRDFADDRHLQTGLAGVAASLLFFSVQQPCSARQSLPPIDPDPNRCERAYTGNTIGQANAVADRILDLRKCNYAGKDLSKKVLAGALISESDLSKTNLVEAVLTKAYAVGANLQGADMTNAVVDRVNFRQSNLTNAKFKNAVITGSVFEDAKLDGVVFEDALIGREDVKKLCQNPSLQGEAREDVGCRK